MRGSPQRINESPWARCLQGAVDARWVVVVDVVVAVVVLAVVAVVVVVVCLFVCLFVCLLCCRRRPRGGIWTNRAEARGQLVLLPVGLPEQLRSSRLVHLAANFA